MDSMKTKNLGYISHVYSLAFLYGNSIFSEGFSTSSKVNIRNQRTPQRMLSLR